jgi:hypothetical protein
VTLAVFSAALVLIAGRIIINFVIIKDLEKNHIKEDKEEEYNQELPL